MPSKNYNGNQPLGRSIKVQGDNLQGSIAQVESKVAKLQPAQSMETGMLQLPNGRVHVPKKTRFVSSSSGCTPWKPRIVDEREKDAKVPDYKLYLNPGTVNGILSATWNTGIDFPTPPEEGDPPVKFIVLKLTFSQVQLNAITYELASSIPTAADLDPVGRNVLPDTLSIIIGTFIGLQPCMIYDKNLSVESVDVFHERLTGITLGEQPFYVWYKYATRVVE
jgi:hypothetical protein